MTIGSGPGEPMFAATVGVSPLILVFDLACLLGVIWTAVDMAKQLALSRRQKAMWLPCLIFSFLLIRLVGLVAAVFYFVAVRPKLLARSTR
jgi:hypothetical protein